MGPELFDAVRALLVAAVPAHVKVHDTDASHVAGTASSYPFIVLSGGIPRQFAAGAGWCRDDADALIRVTHTALSAGAVRNLVRSTRAALEDARPVIPGWHGFELAVDDSSGVNVDRDVKIVNSTTAQNPFYAVDIYRVQATR